MDRIEALPFAPVTVDTAQQYLTMKFILPVLDHLHDYLIAIRGSLDPKLLTQYPFYHDKPYPLGRCLEITDAVRQELFRRLRRPRRRIERLLNNFVREGGIIRPIWGALRGRYFQNATQIGSLYVDVSNDTVSFMKPRVEILPMEHCGMEPIRDLAHFRYIAGQYWQMTFFANNVAPSLAPLLPMIGLDPYGDLRLESPTAYMVALLMRDGFGQSEEWVRTAPLMPHAYAAFMSAIMPDDLRVPAGQDGRVAAIAACRQARAQQRHLDQGWKAGLIADYRRFINNAQANLSTRIAA